jgi:hypothetical protein
MISSVVRWMGGHRRPARAAAVAMVACNVAACSSVWNAMPDPGEFRLPDRSTFVPTTTNNFGLPISPTSAVTTADMVNAQGQCSAPASSAAASSPSARGVSLDMTECQVVNVLGQPQSIDYASASGSLEQRRLTMTYTAGERPGIYQFIAGRLSSIDRGNEPPPPAVAKKPAKKSKQQPAA